MVCACGGPVQLFINPQQFAGTKADYVKFHDDKSQYTGVYANGGPSNVDAGNGMIGDLS